MNCQQATRHIWDYCDNKLSPALGAAVESHCRECQQCNKHLQLTILENEALKNTTQLPDLSPGFTARVMKNLPTEDLAAGKKKRSTWSRGFTGHKRWMAASSVLMGILLLLLVLPGIKPTGIINFTKQSVVPPVLHQEEFKNDMSIGTVPAGSEESQTPGNYGGDASVIEEKKVLSSPEVTSDDIAPPPAPTTYSGQPAESSSTISRGTTVNNSTKELAVAEAPYHVSLPGPYTLLNITSNEDKSLSYQFAQAKSNVVVDVIVSKVEDAKPGGGEAQTPKISTVPDNNSQTAAKSYRDSNSNSEISWTILSGNTPYRLTLNGNLPPQELALLASSIGFTVK